MAKRRRHGELSTLDPWLAGSRVHGDQVQRVLGAPKSRATRDVVMATRTKRVPVPELQDHLLLEKGYLPKYSKLPLEHFLKSRGVSKEDARRMKKRVAYWAKKLGT